MSQQINLFNPALRKPRDWLMATPLLAAAAVVLVLILAGAHWAKVRGDQREREAVQQEAQLKAAQNALTALAKRASERKPDPRLAADVANAQAQLRIRQEIVTYLENGSIGTTTGFAEYLRGFARQVPKGLWLTGFTIGAGGSDMEIRGRMLNAAMLPEYIRRLNGEKAFQGRSFAALTIKRPEQEKKAPGKGPAAAAPDFVEFVLTPSASASAPAKDPEKKP